MTRITWLDDVLRDAGLNVVLVPGWREAGSDRFDPIGVLVHHTASKRGANAPSLSTVRFGRPGPPVIPGPLCQLLIARDGTCYPIASGNANHAGKGGPLRTIPKDGGNSRLVGIEAENDGVGEPWPPVVVDAMERATAAILARLGQPAAHVWGHKEWAPGRKIDPQGIDMDQFRAAVARRMTGGATVPDKPPTDLTAIWQQMLLDNGANLGPAKADGQFGRLTLDASQTILDHRNQLLKTVEDLTALNNKLLQREDASAETIKRLVASSDTAKADLGRASVEIDRLRAEVQRVTELYDGPAVQATVRQALAQLDGAKSTLAELGGGA